MSRPTPPNGVGRISPGKQRIAPRCPSRLAIVPHPSPPTARKATKCRTRIACVLHLLPAMPDESVGDGQYLFKATVSSPSSLCCLPHRILAPSLPQRLPDLSPPSPCATASMKGSPVLPLGLAGCPG